MIKQHHIALLSLTLILCACNTQAELIKPLINEDLFPGFTLTPTGTVKLEGYDFQASTGTTFTPDNCNTTLDTPESNIADYEYHRYKLLLLSCRGYIKYTQATPSKRSFLLPTTNTNWVKSLPAEVLPLLSKQDLITKQNKTIEHYYEKKASFMSEGPSTVKVTSKHDEQFISLLARGDFTHDGIEDLLVLTEWYARDAHGKHADLLIISKTSDSNGMEVSWRHNSLD